MKRAIWACIWLTVACGTDRDGVAQSPAKGTDGSAGTSGTATNLVGTKDIAAVNGQAKLGDACLSADECPAGGSGTPACLSNWPSGGYCVVEACTDHGHDCPGDPGNTTESTTGAKCVLDPEPRCLALCATTADCRSGYVCSPRSDAAGHASVNVCVPEASATADSASGSSNGTSQEGAANDSMGGGGDDGMMMMEMDKEPTSASGAMSSGGASGSASMATSTDAPDPAAGTDPTSAMAAMAGAPAVTNAVGGMAGAGGMAGSGTMATGDSQPMPPEEAGKSEGM